MPELHNSAQLQQAESGLSCRAETSPFLRCPMVVYLLRFCLSGLVDHE